MRDYRDIRAEKARRITGQKFINEFVGEDSDSL